jgi:GNAT superfamily N-acetyltransferase
MTEIKRLSLDDAPAAADIHRTAGALIPHYDTTLHTPAEYVALYRGDVLVNCEAWGVFEEGVLAAFIAVRPGWIDHLYVTLGRHRSGLGSRLLVHAQSLQAELRLYTFQANVNARAFYEKHGFVVEELTDGARNEEKMPDATYLWTRR